MYILPGALSPLSQYAQFILVQLAPALDERGNAIPGKSVKHPISQHTLMRHNAHDPAIWMTWEAAAQLAASLAVPPGTIGWCIGFVITAADPVVCLDIDSCATLAGSWNDDAQELMRRFPGAYEVSLSGQGLHGWGFYSGVIPAHGKKPKGKNIELYTELRFIALGGDAVGQMYDLTALLPQFIADYFPPQIGHDDAISGWTDSPVPEHTPLTDDELISRAMSRTRVNNASQVFGTGPVLASFSDLWSRNVDVLSQSHPAKTPGKEFDYSEVDMALAKELAYWTGKDCERVLRLMDMSALKRDKWSPAVHRTYLRETVLRGVSFCTAVYRERPLVLPTAAVAAGPGALRLQPKVIEHTTIVGRENLAVLFAGCVYIQDMNCVLLPNGDMVDQPRFNAKFAGYTFCMDNKNEKVSKSAWEAFLGNQIIAFPRCEGTEFNPRLEFQDVVERAGRSWVNVYKAPSVIRAPGDVGPFMDLLRKLLPHGDDALILLSYMAAVCQYPGVKFRWAPFIQGAMGNGKSTLVECLKYALGYKYIFSVKTGMIENNFNSWLEHNVLYVADDIYSAKDRTDMMEALKSLITERDHAVTLKGIDSIQKRICGNFIFTDNHKDAMRKQDETRRICTLYCAQQSARDRMRDGLTKAFFVGPGGFIKWLEAGGYQSVAELLHTMPIDPRYDPAGECQEAPNTSVTREAIIDGRTGVEHDVAEWIELEEPGFCGNFVSYHMLKVKLESMPRHSKFVNPLKIKEMLLRLGYEQHRKLIGGRVPKFVAPDGTKPILYVKCDSWQSELDDPDTIAAMYEAEQQKAQTRQTERVFKHGGVR